MVDAYSKALWDRGDILRTFASNEPSGNLGTYAGDIALYSEQKLSIDVEDTKGCEYLQ